MRGRGEGCDTVSDVTKSPLGPTPVITEDCSQGRCWGTLPKNSGAAHGLAKRQVHHICFENIGVFKITATAVSDTAFSFCVVNVVGWLSLPRQVQLERCFLSACRPLGRNLIELQLLRF